MNGAVRGTARRAPKGVARLLPAAAIAFLAAAPARPARAQMPEVPPGKWWKRPLIVRMLNITADQQAKLEAIFSRHRREFVDLKADVERRRIDVEDLVAKKDSDARNVSEAVDALEVSRFKLRKAATMMFLEQKDVLSASQWQQILDKRDEWRRQRQMERRGGSRRELSPDEEAGPRSGRERPQPPPQEK